MKVLVLVAKCKDNLSLRSYLISEPKPILSQNLEQLRKKTCDIVSANKLYINANGVWPDFTMKTCVRSQNV